MNFKDIKNIKFWGGSILLSLYMVTFSFAEFEKTPVSYRAVYKLSLNDDPRNKGFSSLSGGLYYEFIGSACEGYAINSSFRSIIENYDRPGMVIETRQNFFEEPGSTKLNFFTKTQINDSDVNPPQKGWAEIVKGKINLHVNGEKREIVTPNGQKVYLPAEHFKRVHQLVLSGKKFIKIPVFDIGDNKMNVFISTVVIGKETKDPETFLTQIDKKQVLKKMHYWPVTVRYFENKKTKSSALEPLHIAKYNMYENGVISKLKLVYDNLSIEGTLHSLELVNNKKCP